MIVNGVADIAIAICLIIIPRSFARILQFENFNDSFRFLAGGYGIAALCFGITRIWVANKHKFFWETVIVGLIEGSLLGTFCVIMVIMTDITFIHAFLSILIGFGYMIIYGGSLIIKSKNT
ncbi:MAG: hypothetical protein ACTSVK_11730 [Promethearchaeota archaeon]